MKKKKRIVFCRSERGFAKRRNEDFIFSESDDFFTTTNSVPPLWILADGFGGNINSNLAVRDVVHTLVKSYLSIEGTLLIEERLKISFTEAQKQLCQKASDWDTPGLRVGISLGILEQNKSYIVNMGGGLVMLSTTNQTKDPLFAIIESDSEPMSDQQLPRLSIHVIDGCNQRLALLSDGFLQYLDRDSAKTVFSNFHHKAFIDKLYTIAKTEDSDDNLSVVTVESEQKTNGKPFILLLLLIVLLGILALSYRFNPLIQSFIKPFSKEPIQRILLNEEMTQPELMDDPIQVNSEEPIGFIPTENDLAPEIEPKEEFIPETLPPLPSESIEVPRTPSNPTPLRSVPPAPPVSIPPAPPASKLFEKTIVTLQSNPFGVRIHVNGTFRGLTPLNIELSPGTYSIVFSKPPLYQELIQTLILKGEKADEQISVILKQKYYSIEINSNPSDAKVYINDSYKGLSPIVLHLEPGNWQLTVSKPGFEDYQERIVVTDTQNPAPVKLPLVQLIPSKPAHHNGWRNLEAL